MMAMLAGLAIAVGVFLVLDRFALLPLLLQVGKVVAAALPGPFQAKRALDALGLVLLFIGLWSVFRLVRWWLGRWKLKGPAHAEKGAFPAWTVGTGLAIVAAAVLSLLGRSDRAWAPAGETAVWVAYEMVVVALYAAAGYAALRLGAATRNACKASTFRGGVAALGGAAIAAATLMTGRMGGGAKGPDRLSLEPRAQLTALIGGGSGTTAAPSADCWNAFAGPDARCAPAVAGARARFQRSRLFARDEVEDQIHNAIIDTCAGARDYCAEFKTITVNRVFHAHRHAAKFPHCPIEFAPDPACPAPWADDRLYTCQVRALVYAAFDELDAVDRKILALIVGDRPLTYAQAGARLGLGEDAARKRFDNALQRWLARIAMRCPEVASAFQ